MRCVTKGEKRQEFFDRFEELASGLPVDKWEGGSTITVLRRGVEFDSRCGHTNSAKSFPGREKEVARVDDGGQRVEKTFAGRWARCGKKPERKVNEQRTAELEEEMSEAWRNRQFALLHTLRVEYARNGRGPKKTIPRLATHCLGPRGVDKRNGETCFRRRDGVLGVGLGNELQQLRETVQRDGRRRTARRLECNKCSGTGQSSDFEVREKSTKKKRISSLVNPC